MSDDPVGPLFDYDITFSAADEGHPPTAHALLHYLGVPKDASAERRQEALDRWLAAANEPGPFLAGQLRRMGLRLPSQLLVKLQDAAAALETIIISVISASGPVPQYLGGESAEPGDRYQISLAQHGNSALIEATRQPDGWQLTVLDIDRGHTAVVDDHAIDEAGLHLVLDDAISIIDYLADTVVIDES